MRQWIRDRSLSITFFWLWILFWGVHLIFEWKTYVDHQNEHGEPIGGFGDADFLEEFFRATFENNQSEMLQLFSFVIFSAYLVHKMSAESKDSDERIEAKLDAIMATMPNAPGPKQVESTLNPAYHNKVEFSWPGLAFVLGVAAAMIAAAIAVASTIG